MSKTSWNELTAKKYLGDYKDSFFGYSLIDPIRENAASGGITSTLVIDAFRHKKINGALLCRSFVEANEVKAEYYIAASEEQIIQSLGSKYIATRFSSDAGPLIRSFKGKLAVVCLPCDSLILNNLRKKDPELDKKLVLVITLFCGHSSEKELTQLVLKKLNPQEKEIKDYHYRFGHWRGNLKLDLTDGSQVIKPFSYFSDYQNLFFFCEAKCLQCNDQTGFYSDISIGDIWSMKMKDNPIKHNAILVRTLAGMIALEGIQNHGLAHIFPVPIGELCAGQSRSLILHANVNARVWAAKHYKIRLQPTSEEKTTFLEKAVANVILFNYRFSHSKAGRKIIPALPRFVIKFYLYAFKALQVMLKPKRIYHTVGIIGGSIWGNRGAEAMLVTTIAKLKEKYPDADFKIFSIYPKKDRELINDPRIQVMSSKPTSLVTRYFPFAMLDWLFSRIGIHIWVPSAVRRLKQCSVLYDIGGITFAERGMVLLYNIFTLWPAMLLGVPVVKLSQAVGPFKSTTNRVFAKLFLSKCKKLYTRGEISRDFLEGLKLKKVPSTLAADIAFCYLPEYSLSVENPEKVKELSDRLAGIRTQGKGVIIFSPSSVVLKKINSPVYEQMILNAIKKIDQPDYHYVFLPSSNRAESEKSQNNDIFVLRNIRVLAESQLSTDLMKRIDWIDWDLNTKSIREILQHANLVVTSRFHCMISSLALGVPVYVIGWSHKYQEVLRMFNCEEDAIDFSKANGESLAAEIIRVLAVQKEIKAKIKQNLPGVTKLSQLQFDETEVIFK
jgi:coenzyme F420-reducing hydrogenase beta subunit/polysaccharide pyruvyl transferase WcaK-like protein